MTSLTDLADAVIGVDTHVDTHTAAIVDARTGAVLDQLTVPADGGGYAELAEFVNARTAASRVWAIEGTGSHGAGLTRFLTARDEVVVELDRPKRPYRRNGAKSDALDAVRAARDALSRDRVGSPRRGSRRQVLAMLLAARESAVNAAADAQRQLFSLVIAAPEPIRARFRGQSLPRMQRTALALRQHAGWDDETRITVNVLRSLARRARDLSAEAAEHEREIRRIVQTWRPDLLTLFGVGPIVAATVLCAWSHPGRIHSEAAFAMIAGVAPIPASSGRTTRNRLNRHGDRRLNRALNTIALCRLRYDQRTREFAAHRTADGKTRRDIIRCLKRYIARDLYRTLEHPA